MVYLLYIVLSPSMTQYYTISPAGYHCIQYLEPPKADQRPCHSTKAASSNEYIMRAELSIYSKVATAFLLDSRSCSTLTAALISSSTSYVP